MKSLFSVLLIFLLNYSIFSQNSDIDLSKIKLCETKISDFKDTFNIIPVVGLDVCPDGTSPLKIPGFQYNSGYVFSSYKGATFQIRLADSTICRIILGKQFKGYLTDGKYIDMSNLKAKDIVDKNSIYWFSGSCSEYLGLGYKNIKFYLKREKSSPWNTINEEFYCDKNIEIITIESRCFK